MATEESTKMREEEIIPKSSEIFLSVETGCLKFLDSYSFLDASLDKLSTTLNIFPSLDANGMKDSLCKRKLVYPYEKGKTFYKPSNLGREGYFSTLQQS